MSADTPDDDDEITIAEFERLLDIELQAIFRELYPDHDLTDTVRAT